MKLGQVDFVLDDTTYGEQVGPLIASLMISPTHSGRGTGTPLGTTVPVNRSCT